MSYPKSEKSNMVVRAKVPWERNVQGLIAVGCDVESVLERVENEIKSMGKSV